MKRISKIFFLPMFILSILFVFVSCWKRKLAPPIGNNMSFPGAMVALNTNNFLLLNTSANGDYFDGSIQRYSVDSSGNYSLQNVLSVPAHGTELAVSSNSQLVALSFDSSYVNTQMQFYNFSNVSNPALLSNITLKFPASGGKQAIRRIGIFQRSADPAYYVYGTIITYQNDDGTSGNIPPRAFVAKVASDFSSSQVLFILSYGLNDPNSLASQSTSLNNQVLSNEVQYTFGFTAPTYDGKNDLFIAFPSGTIGGYNRMVNGYPGLPDSLTYFSGSSNILNCSNGKACVIQPDYRSVSLAAVDMSSIVAGNPLNNSTYFVPLGWNQNGMPYGSISNGTTIAKPNIPTNVDLNSFSFQVGFWSSYWANTKNNGAGASACYPANVTTLSGNQFSVAGDNALFVVKTGSNGGNDLSGTNGSFGNGNEVFAITGLDILSNNIGLIKTAKGSVISAGESDFNKIAQYQLIDPYNSTVAVLSSWITGQGTSVKNAGPLNPFMYSRTSKVSGFDTTSTGITNISVLNFGSNNCQPYWARNTVLTGSMGRDTAWLTANPVTFTGNSTFPYLTNDPTQPSLYSFSVASGAQTCTDVYASANSPRVFCVNYLTSGISKFTVTQLAPVFTTY